MEEYNLHIFILCTHNAVGSLPIGLIITSNEKTETQTSAFEMYQSLLCKESFFGNEANVGTAVIMTDNCSELRGFFGMIWPC